MKKMPVGEVFMQQKTRSIVVWAGFCTKY